MPLRFPPALARLVPFRRDAAPARPLPPIANVRPDAPRSASDVTRALRKTDGWYPAEEFVLPPRLIRELTMLADGGHFLARDLGPSAAAVVAAYLADGYLQAARDVDMFRRGFTDPVDQAEITAAAARLERLLRAAGPVAAWGVRPEAPHRVPSAADRLQVLVDLLEQARLADSVAGVRRYATSIGLDNPTTVMSQPRRAPDRSPEVEAALKQLARRVYWAAATAIGYQELADRYPVVPEGPAGSAATTSEEIAANGEMFVALQRALDAMTAHGVLQTRSALAKIAALELPPIPGERPVAEAMLRGMIEAIEGPERLILGALTGGALAADAARRDRAVRTPILAARLLADVYRQVEDREADAIDPASTVGLSQYEQVLALAERQVVLGRAASLDDALQQVAAAPGGPAAALRETARARLAAQMACDVLDAPAAPAALPEDVLLAAAPSARGAKVWQGAVRGVRREHPTWSTGMAEASLRMMTHAAAIGVGAHRAGVAVETLLADLEAGRLPGVRGAGEFVGLDGTWDVPHGLSSDGVRFVARAIAGARDADALQQMAADLAADALAVPRHPRATQGRYDDAATPVQDGLFRYGGLARGDWLTRLVSRYVAFYADGRVRVPGGDDLPPRYAPLAGGDLRAAVAAVYDVALPKPVATVTWLPAGGRPDASPGARWVGPAGNDIQVLPLGAGEQDDFEAMPAATPPSAWWRPREDGTVALALTGPQPAPIAEASRLAGVPLPPDAVPSPALATPQPLPVLEVTPPTSLKAMEARLHRALAAEQAMARHALPHATAAPATRRLSAPSAPAAVPAGRRG